MKTREAFFFKFLLLLIGILFSYACLAVDFTGIKKNLKNKYSEITMTDVSPLYDELSKNKTAYILLDARTPKEYAVSHIYQAHNSPNIEEALEILQGQSKEAPIVVYCSLGYRSAELVIELQEKGYSNVQNLAGSLFEWVDKDYPVYQGTSEVKKVHPYNLWWGRHLRQDYRSYKP